MLCHCMMDEAGPMMPDAMVLACLDVDRVCVGNMALEATGRWGAADSQSDIGIEEAVVETLGLLK